MVFGIFIILIIIVFFSFLTGQSNFAIGLAIGSIATKIADYYFGKSNVK